MKTLITLILFVILAAGALFAFINSGYYNIAATEPHNKLISRVLNTAMEKSVKKQAEGIEVPDLSDKSMIETGFHHYNEMCVTCHGAPGISASEIGRGINPEPPDLVEEIDEVEWKLEELFWITKHGIKYTGMPAFGPTHSDQELWTIVAFMKRLPTLSPEDYQAMEKAAEQLPHTHRHEHSLHKHGKEKENAENDAKTPAMKKEQETHIHKDGEEHGH